MINKYRPKRLSEVFGNQDVIASLEKAISKNEIPHGILLYGETGCGKTTIARIIANHLGCYGGNPPSVIEINCADKSGRDEVRGLIDTVILPPLFSDNKVVILDEAAELSSAAQQTLLKAIEETPPYLYWIVCSTPTKKIIPTLINRLVKYEIKPLTTLECKKFIYSIWEQEGFHDTEENVQKMINGITRKSEGIPRSAITILAAVKDLTFEQSKKIIIGFEDEDNVELIELARILAKNAGTGESYTTWIHNSGVIGIYKSLRESYSDESIRIFLLNYFRSAALSSGDPKYFRIIEILTAPCIYPEYALTNSIYCIIDKTRFNL